MDPSIDKNVRICPPRCSNGYNCVNKMCKAKKPANVIAPGPVASEPIASAVIASAVIAPAVIAPAVIAPKPVEPIDVNVRECPPRCRHGYNCVNKRCKARITLAAANPSNPEPIAPALIAPALIAPALIAPEPIAPEPATIVDKNVRDCPPRCPTGYTCDKKTKKCKSNLKPIKILNTLTEAPQLIPDVLPEPVLPEPVLPEPVLPEPVLPEPAIPESDEPAMPAPAVPAPAVPAPAMPQIPVRPLETKDEDLLLFIQGNKEALIKEEREYNQMSSRADNNNYQFLYPNLNDANFNTKIANKKEFADTKYDGTIRKDMEEYSNILCNAEFELAPYQLFVRNFLSFQTPYNSLLLYHGVGTGKTCSAISISEEMRDYLMQMGVTNKILIVASPNVQNNFRLQLFDENKLKNVDGLWNINACTGNKFLKEINPFNTKELTREIILAKVQQIIHTYYKFMGYVEFANEISRVATLDENVDRPKTTKQKNELIRGKLQKHFNNQLIIIDEVHNIRTGDESNDKRVPLELYKLVKNVNNLRLLLLSATPMYNTYKEIIWLINLMNMNDRRPTIEIKDVFNADGTFKINKETGEQIGKDLLIRKATGYVSFVRGENPYTFPYRIWPIEFAEANTFSKQAYPTKQLNGLPVIQGIEIISVFLNEIGDYQQKGYTYIVEKLKKETLSKKNITFDNMESFGFALLQKPLEALNIVYPDERLDEQAEQLEAEQQAQAEQQLDAQQAQAQQMDIDTSEIVGEAGLYRIMDYECSPSPCKQPGDVNAGNQKRFNFKYKSLDKYGRIFSPQELKKYSSKIANVCERIRQSSGVVLVYARYISGGVLPIALALEEMGFTRARDGRSLFETPPTEPIDAFTFQPKSAYSAAANNGRAFQGAKYVMITGDKGFTPDSISDIKLLTSDSNKDGSKIKVVLISQAASEGVDFKFIRQVHILDPWYNMNRIEQIIGRAVRNCSHKMLPFSQRNVEIYLYGTILKDKTEEAADLYVYRLAELKAIQIGHISRVLKEVSVDCLLNYAQTNFTRENMEKNGIAIVEQELSSNKQILPYKVGDKPYSATCDYLKKCMYTCVPPPSEQLNQNKDTYGLAYMASNSDKIIQRIKALFKERFFYRKQDLLHLIVLMKNYPLENINYALLKLVEDKYEYVTDKYGRLGNIIAIGDLYLFQPIELTNKKSTLYDKTVPIDYKHGSITLLAKKKKPEDEQQNAAQPEVVESVSREILVQMKENYEMGKNKQVIKSGEVNWYKYSNLVIEEMQTREPGRAVLLDFLVAHIIEELQFKDMLILLNAYSTLNASDEFEGKVKKYIDEMIILSSAAGPNVKGMILTLDGASQIVVESSGLWKKAESEDINDLGPKIKKIIEQYLPIKNKLNKYVGFMVNFKKEYMVFKVKDTTNKRAKGSRCDQTSKNASITLLNELIIGGGEYTMNSFEYQRQVCCKQEFMLRFYDKEKKLGKRWYIPPGEAALIKLETL